MGVGWGWLTGRQLNSPHLNILFPQKICCGVWPTLFKTWRDPTPGISGQVQDHSAATQMNSACISVIFLVLFFDVSMSLLLPFIPRISLSFCKTEEKLFSTFV